MEIEKNVPMPTPTTGRPRRYPLPDMEVGDSFAVPIQGVMTPKGDKAALLVSSAAKQYSKRHGGKFVIRTDRENGVVRCWRMA